MTHFSDGDTFLHNGTLYRVNLEHDDITDAPWDREDGHGPVSDWTTRDKEPGEWVLVTDRSSSRYYDAREAMAIAKRDGWGLAQADIDALARKFLMIPTQGMIAAEAVRQDFERLRRWCNDQWEYVGVIVTRIPDETDEDDAGEVENDYCRAIWGIESDCPDYIAETVMDLVADIEAESHCEVTEAEWAAARNIATVEG